MSDNAFVLPADVELDLSGEALSLKYGGNVHLHQSFGKPLGAVAAGGDIVIALPTATGNLYAGGKLEIQGNVDAESLFGREVIIQGTEIDCKSISASERIVLGAARFKVDVILAPEIVIDPGATGRVTVIESRNEREATKIKGGFSLVEYEELFGDSTQFLSERGVAPMGEAPPAPVAPTVPAAPAEKPAPAKAAKAPPPEEKPSKKKKKEEPKPEPPVIEEAELETLQPDEEPEEDLDDPLSLSVDDLQPVEEQREEEDELYDQLLEAVEKISACYEGGEVPPAILRLRALIEAREYDTLRGSITEVWNGLLGFHQQRGIRPHHQVTHSFNVIHGLLQPT